MKRIIFSILTILVGVATVSAQKTIRLGYIDMEYILENVPEYQEAKQQLDNRVQDWKKEAETKLKEVANMKTKLENERALLTKELIQEREDEIKYMESQAMDFQQKKFGPNGEYMNQKKQLVRPVQDQVFAAVQEIAKNRNFDFIFDRTSDIGMIYADQQYDVSDLVLRTIKRTANREQLEGKKEITEMEKAEERTPEQDKAIDKREQLIEQKKNEREAVLEQRRKERDSIKEARQKEFDERRAKILEERQKRQDSIQKLREKKNDTIN